MRGYPRQLSRVYNAGSRVGCCAWTRAALYEVRRNQCSLCERPVGSNRNRRSIQSVICQTMPMCLCHGSRSYRDHGEKDETCCCSLFGSIGLVNKCVYDRARENETCRKESNDLPCVSTNFCYCVQRYVPLHGRFGLNLMPQLLTPQRYNIACMQ